RCTAPEPEQSRYARASAGKSSFYAPYAKRKGMARSSQAKLAAMEPATLTNVSGLLPRLPKLPVAQRTPAPNLTAQRLDRDVAAPPPPGGSLRGYGAVQADAAGSARRFHPFQDRALPQL